MIFVKNLRYHLTFHSVTFSLMVGKTAAASAKARQWHQTVVVQQSCSQNKCLKTPNLMSEMCIVPNTIYAIFSRLTAITDNNIE
jgi:hypothetical protein